MASSSSCFIVVTMTILSQFLLASTSALTISKYIDSNCQRVNNKPFCIDTLTTYPPAIAATSLLPLAESVIGLATSHAEKTAGFAAEMANKEATLKTQFNECHNAFVGIAASLKSAKMQLKEAPDTANYDVMVSSDQIRLVKDLVGKNSDKASLTIMEMTLQMEKLLDLAAGATDAIDDDDENVTHRA